MGHPHVVRLPFFFFFILGCAAELGLINKEDMDEIRKGNDLDKFATKIALALVNLCGNLSEVRYEATMAATRFVRSQTKEEYNVNNVLRKAKRRFVGTDDNNDEEEGEIVEKKKRIETTIINEKTSNHELMSTVNVSAEGDNLGNFVSSMFVDDVVFPEFEILETHHDVNGGVIELLDD